MWRQVLIIFAVTGLAGATPLQAGESSRSCCRSERADAAKQAPASSRMRCSLTGAIVETCCCVERQGKLHCTLADKDVESCCCHPVPVTTGGSEEGAPDSAAAAKTLP